MMKTTLLSILLVIGAGSLPAQVGQDVKDAGHATKDAATTATKKTKNGTTKAYHASKNGAKKVVHKSANETAEGADKVSQKTATDTSTK
jgi:predicted small secreted protein